MRTVIVQPALDIVSETFLRSHMTHLPNVVGVVHWESALPAVDGRTMLSQRPMQRTARRLYRFVLGRPWHSEITAGYREAFRRLRPDVVLAQYGFTGVSVLDACIDGGIPLVVHFHGYDAWKARIIEKNHDGYAKVFRSACALVAGCKSMAEQLVNLGAPRAKVVVNYVSTVDPDVFKIQNCAANPPRFLSIGRMVEKKAPHLTLLAFSQVLPIVPSANLTMIGDGPLLPICRDLAAALGIDHAVSFLGAQPHNAVADEMRKARAFVQHSVVAADGDREGTALSVLEAAASGLAIVATRHEGINETMIHGQTAFLVEERDVDSMARHLLTLALEPDTAARLGRNAASHIKALYTMRQSVDRLAAILEAAATGESLLTIKDEFEAEPTSGIESSPSLPPVAIAL